MRTRERHLFFLQKTIELSHWPDKISFRTAPPTELCCLHSQVIWILSSYLKFGSRHEDSSRFYRKQGRLATRKSRSARFKNSFSNVQLVSEVNCSKSSNIHMICSRSNLKRLKGKHKSAILMLRIIAKVSQRLYYDFMALVFLNV